MQLIHESAFWLTDAYVQYIDRSSRSTQRRPHDQTLWVGAPGDGTGRGAKGSGAEDPPQDEVLGVDEQPH